jgi:hypothetical protein
MLITPISWLYYWFSKIIVSIWLSLSLGSDGLSWAQLSVGLSWAQLDSVFDKKTLVPLSQIMVNARAMKVDNVVNARAYCSVDVGIRSVSAPHGKICQVVYM